WDLDLAGDLEWESSRRMESSTVVYGITVDLKAKWINVEYALKSR
ncbi:hypothetical protein A2U01_0099229, partial [Trifolium medium]|nr:hypothetical protein [Trifolium medium]